VKRLSAGIAALVVLLGIPAVVAFAVPAGTLDPTFSHDGIATSSLLSNDYPTQVQVDAQNRVIVGGFDAARGVGLVLRYTAKGTPDPTWKPYYLTHGYGRITGIALAGTKTLVSTTGVHGNKGGRLLKLNANGSLDKTFGVSGVLSALQEGCGFGIYSCALMGVGVGPSGDIFEIYDMRDYDTGGTDSGLLEVSSDGHSSANLHTCCDDPAYAITVSPSYVYVAGVASADYGDDKGGYVARFFLDGSFDTSYGTDGYAWATNGDDYLNALDVAVSPNTGRATIVGLDCTNEYFEVCSGFVARFTTAGLPDPTFQGQVDFGDGVGSSEPTGVTMQNTGVVVVGIDTNCNNAATSCLGVERLTSNGAFDTAFAGTGRVHVLDAPQPARAGAPMGVDVRVFNRKIVASAGQYAARFQG
jgi:uncharacterized delta-60 repeat protein